MDGFKVGDLMVATSTDGRRRFLRVVRAHGMPDGSVGAIDVDDPKPTRSHAPKLSKRDIRRQNRRAQDQWRKI